MTPEERKRSLTYYQSRGMMDTTTGKMTSSEVTAIFQQEIQKDLTAILIELPQGKYNTLNAAVERAFTRTCTQGAAIQAQNMFKQYWYIFAGIAVIALYLIFKKK